MLSLDKIEYRVVEGQAPGAGMLRGTLSLHGWVGAAGLGPVNTEDKWAREMIARQIWHMVYGDLKVHLSNLTRAVLENIPPEHGETALQLCNKLLAAVDLPSYRAYGGSEGPGLTLEDVVLQSEGIRRGAAERSRQIKDEGFMPRWDEKWTGGELLDAGLSYIYAAINVGHPAMQRPPREWPWVRGWWKPSEDPVRNLEKAAALITAEIDRILRERGEEGASDE